MLNIVDNDRNMNPLNLVKHALDTTISLIKSGTAPTEALEKVSKELQLNKNYIQRVGENLNVALHYNHFRKSAEDRAQDFPVADIPTVTKNIFGQAEKTITEKKAEWFPEVAPKVNYSKFLTHKPFQKIASDISTSKANLESFGTTLKTTYKKAQDYISALEKELDHLQTEKVANDIYIESCFNALVKAFKKTAEARQEFHDFETKALYSHGDRAEPYIDLLYKAANLTEGRGRKDTIQIFDKTAELDLFESLLKAASRHTQLETELNDVTNFVTFQKCAFKAAGQKLCSSSTPQEKTASEEYADILDQALEKIAGPVTSSLLSDLLTQLSDVAYGRDKQSPAFKNSKMDNMTRTTLLQELIMTDPILKHQDPRKIIQAYQQILRLAPHLAMEKEVVRSLLRSMTAAQSLGTMEANQLIEGNTAYLKQHQMLRSGDAAKKKDK